jgi:hypothetical protein
LCVGGCDAQLRDHGQIPARNSSQREKSEGEEAQDRPQQEASEGDSLELFKKRTSHPCSERYNKTKARKADGNKEMTMQLQLRIGWYQIRCRACSVEFPSQTTTSKYCASCKVRQVFWSSYIKPAYNKSYKVENIEKLRPMRNSWQRESRNKLKLEVIKQYGGECVCCGESEPEFLTIDHIYGGGRKQLRENKEIGNGGSSLYRWLKENGWPQDKYQLLCFNCNCAKGTYGECPHQTMRKDSTSKEVFNAID